MCGGRGGVGDWVGVSGGIKFTKEFPLIDLGSFIKNSLVKKNKEKSKVIFFGKKTWNRIFFQLPKKNRKFP